MFPYFSAQWSSASSGYRDGKRNEPGRIVSHVRQDRRQRLGLTHNGQAPWAIGDLVPLLVNPNTTEKSVEQHDETGSGYDSKSDNRSNEIRRNRQRLGIGTGDVGTVFTKYREAICRRSHLECAEGQMFDETQERCERNWYLRGHSPRRKIHLGQRADLFLSLFTHTLYNSESEAANAKHLKVELSSDSHSG